MSGTWGVVVPSHRPERLQAWLDQWANVLEGRAHLILIEDAPEPFTLNTYGLNPTVATWQDLPEWFPRQTDMVRSWGILAAWRMGFDYTLTLDDDVLPTADLLTEYEAVFDQGAPCSPYLDIGALTTSGLHMRGFPYADRNHAKVGLQYGGWSGCLDYDAATQLAVPRGDERFHPIRVAVPRGAALTGCIMNAAWRTEYAPLMWQLVMHEGRYNRFSDIWSGLYAKRVLDSLGVAVVVNGAAQVRHERASDPFVSLQREAAGNGPNERLWAALGQPKDCRMFRAYRLVTDSAASFFQHSEADPEYAAVFREARDQWLRLFDPTIDQARVIMDFEPVAGFLEGIRGWILVTGAAGTVGSYAADVFDGHDLWLTDREQCDVASRPLRDSMGVRIRFAPALDAVIHLAAATDVDECELDHDLAYRANALGTQNVAEECERAGIPLVYVSTAGVFGGDGGSGPFTEFDPPHPANVYGQAKLAGEVLAREQTRQLYVVRAGWMFGGNTMTDPKFVGMIARLLKNGSCRAVADKTGSPTYARDLLVGIRRMLEDQWPYGTYHMANAGVCTRFDVACAVRDLTMPGAVVAPATSDEFPLPAPRADSEAMVSYKAGLLGLPVLRPWREALAEHLGASARAAA